MLRMKARASVAVSSTLLVKRGTKYASSVNSSGMAVFLSNRCSGSVSWAGRIVLRIPRVAGLNHEVPAVPVQTSAVNHILTIGVEAIPLAVEPVVEPVFEVTDEEVVVAHAEEAAVFTVRHSRSTKMLPWYRPFPSMLIFTPRS